MDFPETNEFFPPQNSRQRLYFLCVGPGVCFITKADCVCHQMLIIAPQINCKDQNTLLTYHEPRGLCVAPCNSAYVKEAPDGNSFETYGMILPFKVFELIADF